MNKNRGFTIVELMVAVIVVGILASIVMFAFGSWRSGAAKAEVKNDLVAAVSKLRDYRNWNNAYPADQAAFASLYQVSGKLTMTYTLRASGASYCLNATSSAVSTVKFYIDSNVSTTPVAGTTSCT